MDNLTEILKLISLNAVFILTTLIFGSYLLLTIFSAIALRRYLRRNSYVNYNDIVSSPFAPTLSVIAPAFNESQTIIDNIRTLLSLYYNNYEVIVVNDGSRDDSLEKMIRHYELELVNYHFDYLLHCKQIRGIYKSKNKSFKKLTVIDKLNGGKADSLNAGINMSQNELVVSIDADSILEPDALLKLVKPFTEAREKRVIAAGGVIRVANSCEISGGHIHKVHLPKNLLARMQVLEYTRAFLMGRMAWSQLDGLLLISGALGMFDREIVIAAGGYRTDTVGEDMELVVRIRRYMADRKLGYDVVYIPDPLCWTEVPSTLKVLSRQRSRWTRGTMETLYTHRKIFLNPRYGSLGILSYPYWLLFEYLAPLVEFLGLVWFFVLVLTGNMNWPFFRLLLGFVYLFAVSLSIWAVFFEEVTFHKYEKKRDVLKLILTAFLEPVIYHPLTMLMSIKGNLDKLFKMNSWGSMERKGFGSTASKKSHPKEAPSPKEAA